MEFRIVLPKGDIRWVRSAACLIQDRTGVAVRAVGFVVDITDAKIAEQKLRESHEALSQAEKLARIGSWTWDITADRAVWSETLYEIFGLDSTKTAPRLGELRKVFVPESFEAFLKVAEQCVKAGTSYSIDLEGIRTDGTHCFVNARGEPVCNASGDIVQVRGTLADITERKSVEHIILPNGKEEWVRTSKIPRKDAAGPGHRRDRILQQYHPRLLIVDDNPSARNILSQMIQRFGVAVEAAASGSAGCGCLWLTTAPLIARSLPNSSSN